MNGVSCATKPSPLIHIINQELVDVFSAGRWGAHFMKLMSLITIKMISIIISKVNDAFCHYPRFHHSPSPPSSIIDNFSFLRFIFFFVWRRRRGYSAGIWVHKIFFIQPFKQRGGVKWTRVLEATLMKKKTRTGDESPCSILHNIFHSIVFFLLERRGKIKIVSSCANCECEQRQRQARTTTNARVGCLRVYNVFSVCYLFDVSLLNELYWHLGDITMNMTLDIISITLFCLPFLQTAVYPPSFFPLIW